MRKYQYLYNKYSYVYMKIKLKYGDIFKHSSMIGILPYTGLYRLVFLFIYITIVQMSKLII